MMINCLKKLPCKINKQPRFFFFLFLILCFVSISCKTINAKSGNFPPGTVVFSFDDGPNDHEDTTLRVLEVLEKHQIRACFCLLGINAEHNPELVRRIALGRHRIINHGFGEKWSVFMNDKAFSANLLEGEKAINAALAPLTLDIPVYRPNGGFYRKKQQRFWEARGYRIAPCTIRIYDAVLSEKDKDKAIHQIIKKIEKQKGGIILLHDSRDSYTARENKLVKNPQGEYNRTWIPAVVEEIIIILQEKNYLISGFDPIEIQGVLQ